MDECSLKFLFDNVVSALKGSCLPNVKQYLAALENNGTSRGRITKDYNKIREDMRLRCESRTERLLLDRHKCAASFMIAILNQLDVEEEKLSKEYFAIFVGLSILRVAINEESNLANNYKLVNYLEDNGFSFPKCIRDEEPYLHAWALGIHYGRLSGKLSTLSVANALYWVERYNRDIVGV